jgi:hypothetical protein
MWGSLEFIVTARAWDGVMTLAGWDDATKDILGRGQSTMKSCVCI